VNEAGIVPLSHGCGSLEHYGEPGDRFSVMAEQMSDAARTSEK
jgi:hypothetical protein